MINIIKTNLLISYYHTLALLLKATSSSLSTIYKVKSLKLSYLTKDALLDLSNEVKRIENEQVDGKIIEAGCALGGSTVIIAQAKNKARLFEAYDVFGMIPPPSKNDGKDVHERYATIKKGKAIGINGEEYYGYKDNLQQQVANTLTDFNVPEKQHNIKLIKGLFENTLKVQDAVALAHIDCDWYDSVFFCLHTIAPVLAVNGKFIMDDYYDWSGCRDATDVFFNDKKEQYTFTKHNNKLHIKKIR